MIIVSGQLLRPQDIENWQIDENLNPLLKEMIETPVQFDYHSIAELMFELKLRMNIVAAAKTLHKSGAKFATFLKNIREYSVLEGFTGRRLGAEIQNAAFKSDSGHS